MVQDVVLEEVAGQVGTVEQFVHAVAAGAKAFGSVGPVGSNFVEQALPVRVLGIGHSKSP
jgi:hypothetical protein